MRTTNEIMSEFGENSKFISINFTDGKWQVSYKTNSDLHTESADTIENAMESMYEWYISEKSPKRIAEKLRSILLDIKRILNFTHPDNAAMSELCDKGIKMLDTDENGNVIWSECFRYDKPQNVAVVSENGTITCTKKKPQQEKERKSDKNKQKVVKKTESDDGLPLYFEVKTPSFMFVKCYGYDVEGNRVCIYIDMQDYKNTSITPGVVLDKEDFPDEMVTAIAEDEFNSRYDEAANLIMNAKNYQPIDYTNVEIIKED